MQTLDIKNPGLPDLQFVLMVLALMTSDIESLNVPESVRDLVFDRCWALVHDTPPPTEKEQRVLDLRQGDEMTLEALVEVIGRILTDQGIQQLTWDHGPSEPTRSTTPEALPLVERLEKFNPKGKEDITSPTLPPHSEN
jgi:hypothetical protein